MTTIDTTNTEPTSGTPTSADAIARYVIVNAWPDPTLEHCGHDAASNYVETFWLPILGPTSTWLYRRLVAGLDHHGGEPHDLDLVEMANWIGLGSSLSKNSATTRSVERLERFDIIRHIDHQLWVRPQLPQLSPRLIRRLPERLISWHDAWTAAA